MSEFSAEVFIINNPIITAYNLLSCLSRSFETFLLISNPIESYLTSHKETIIKYSLLKFVGQEIWSPLLLFVEMPPSRDVGNVVPQKHRRQITRVRVTQPDEWSLFSLLNSYRFWGNCCLVACFDNTVLVTYTVSLNRATGDQMILFAFSQKQTGSQTREWTMDKSRSTHVLHASILNIIA